MDDVIAWSGFAGAWLLVIGPVYQAVLELADQDIQRSRMREVGDRIEGPPRISLWWWLLPPVRYVKERRRQRQWRDAVLRELRPDEIASLVSYLDKAAGWLFVGLGGLLIAAKETWELREHYDWPTYVFWILVVVMLAVATANAAYRMERTHSLLNP